MDRSGHDDLTGDRLGVVPSTAAGAQAVSMLEDEEQRFADRRHRPHTAGKDPDTDKAEPSAADE